MMQNLFVIDRSTETKLKLAVVLLDANVIFDSWKFQKEFASLLETFAALGCQLFTTRSVVSEFLGGTTDTDDLKSKILFLQNIFGQKLEQSFLPISQSLPPNEAFLQFSRQTNKFSSTDFELFITLKEYASSELILMTRNHTDFTSPTFERRGFITLLGKREIHTHGLYTLARKGRT